MSFPDSVIDVGCAIGDYVQYWREELGVVSAGIEGSAAAEPYFAVDDIIVADLRSEVVRLRADLVTCLEVFEHVEIEYIDQFLINLIRMSDQLLVSAAPPGAGGHHHVNCQDKPYWITKMSDLGYEYNVTITTVIKEELKPWRHRKELYHNNLLFFQKEARNVP